MFATAPNTEGNQGAKLSCSRRDAYGNGSPFSLTPFGNRDNFSLLGETVEPFWPFKPQRASSGHRGDGTSLATPIVAGITASIFEFVEPRMPDENHRPGVYRRLKSQAGMIAVFKLMAEQRNGYDYVRPWALSNKIRRTFSHEFAWPSNRYRFYHQGCSSRPS